MHSSTTWPGRPCPDRFGSSALKMSFHSADHDATPLLRPPSLAEQGLAREAVVKTKSPEKRAG